MYRGRSLDNDPELSGLFKITNTDLLRKWKQNCINFKHKFAGECLPLDDNVVKAIAAHETDITEINTPQDFISFAIRLKGSADE